MRLVETVLTNPPRSTAGIATRLSDTMIACYALYNNARWWTDAFDLDAIHQPPWLNITIEIDETVTAWVWRAARYKHPGLDLLLIAAAAPRYSFDVPATQLRLSINGPRTQRPSTLAWELLPESRDDFREDDARNILLLTRIWDGRRSPS